MKITRIKKDNFDYVVIINKDSQEIWQQDKEILDLNSILLTKVIMLVMF
jgi:hypothetical protein